MKNLLLLLCLIPGFSFAQLHDNTWLIGYQGGTGEFGITELTFSNGRIELKENDHSLTVFAELNTCFSDTSGNLLALFNGYWIGDRTGQKMKGGDSIRYKLNPNLLVFGYTSDSDIPQGGMFLPWPGHPDSLLLFYVSQGNRGTNTFVELTSLHLQYALISLSGNGGLGEVTDRRHVVLEDTIQYGRLSACKHANGRDWWLMINEINTNRWYRYLLDPYGLHLLGNQEIGMPMMDGIGQSVYSPDGKHYSSFNAYDSENDFLNVYDFDRCEGLFSNHRQIHFSGFIGGVAISPNSRFLYLSYTDKLYQYDLEAADLVNSEILVGIYDGYINTSYTTFYQAQLAPDNKIYICVYGSTKVLHVIHNPDEAGIACQFEQHGIQLPVYNSESITNSPYFRLGPLDGSPCDTLGLDNQPVAWYRYENDTLDFLNITFHDLSYYEPSNWSWDFGDGNTSTERHPSHHFDSAGVYQVCLTVSNLNSSSTHCKALYLGVSGLDEPQRKEHNLFIQPNPVSKQALISLENPAQNPMDIKIYGINGHLVWTGIMPAGSSTLTLEMGNFPSGIYLCYAINEVGAFAPLRFVVQH